MRWSKRPLPGFAVSDYASHPINDEPFPASRREGVVCRPQSLRRQRRGVDCGPYRDRVQNAVETWQGWREEVCGEHQQPTRAGHAHVMQASRIGSAGVLVQTRAPVMAEGGANLIRLPVGLVERRQHYHGPFSPFRLVDRRDENPVRPTGLPVRLTRGARRLQEGGDLGVAKSSHETAAGFAAQKRKAAQLFAGGYQSLCVSPRT